MNDEQMFLQVQNVNEWEAVRAGGQTCVTRRVGCLLFLGVLCCENDIDKWLL